MKTVLFATTALVASAGIAAADVLLSGSAEMGVFGGDGNVISSQDDPVEVIQTDQELQFHTDIDVTFTLTGETDTGLVFGADVDIDEDIADGGGAVDVDSDDGGAVIFVSGAFGTLTMGDTDGAVDWAMQEAIIGSSIRDNHEHAGYLGLVGADANGDGFIDSTVAIVDGNKGLDGRYDGQVARYEYAFADFAVALSAEIDDDGEEDPILGLGVRYATEFTGVDVAFGAGIQTISTLGDLADDLGDAIDDDVDVDDNQTVWGLSADVDLNNGIRAIVNYSDHDDLGDHWGFAVGYSFDAFTVAANYGQFDGDAVDDGEGWGLIANYDLGGGAELQAGYGNNDIDGFDEFDTYSLGISMSF